MIDKNSNCVAKPLQEELDKLKFFSKPKLALDAVGGASGVRICEALTEVCFLGNEYFSINL